MEQRNSDLWPFKEHLGKPESMHMVYSSLDLFMLLRRSAQVLCYVAVLCTTS